MEGRAAGQAAGCWGAGQNTSVGCWLLQTQGSLLLRTLPLHGQGIPLGARR